MNIDILKKLGFSDKSAQIYLVLLNLGPSSVRKLADFCNLNRGTTYDNLKWLQENNLVSFYNKDSKQIFVVENPDKLYFLVKNREEELTKIEGKLQNMIPELQALYNSGGERPVAKYYERQELKNILEDILETCEKTGEMEYRIYSAEGIRNYLYEDFPTFSDVRVAKNIAVKAIAIGQGGELRGLDERKWLTAENNTPTYIILYPGKTAYISLNAKNEPIGVLIENQGVFQIQKLIFDNLWNKI